MKASWRSCTNHNKIGSNPIFYSTLFTFARLLALWYIFIGNFSVVSSLTLCFFTCDNRNKIFQNKVCHFYKLLKLIFFMLEHHISIELLLQTYDRLETCARCEGMKSGSRIWISYQNLRSSNNQRLTVVSNHLQKRDI